MNLNLIGIAIGLFDHYIGFILEIRNERFEWHYRDPKIWNWNLSGTFLHLGAGIVYKKQVKSQPKEKSDEL